RLPFRIRPGAPTSSIDISAAGNVGLGTASPTRALHVIDTGAADNTVLELQNDGATRIRLNNSANGEVWNIGHQSPAGTGFVLSDVGDSVSEMLLDVSGNMTIAGTLTQGSSRAIKKDIEIFDPATALAGVRSLPIMTWRYSDDAESSKHLGPMAEDFYAAFGLGADNKHIAPGDQAGLALAAIQGLAKEVQLKDEKIQMLEERLAQIESVLKTSSNQ
ncbi:MAG: tail fiber domain-containing protein, partial [Thermoanaerobaculia bacterium]